MVSSRWAPWNAGWEMRRVCTGLASGGGYGASMSAAEREGSENVGASFCFPRDGDGFDGNFPAQVLSDEPRQQWAQVHAIQVPVRDGDVGDPLLRREVRIGWREPSSKELPF